MARASLPRKSASQDRSRALVDFMLDATAHVLKQVGYERATTNRIAAAAGVSIGSLYQYFPNKEALVGALVARHNRDMLELLRIKIEDSAQLSLAASVRTMMTAILTAHQADAELHRIFNDEVPRMGQLAELEQIDRQIVALVRSYLDQRRSEISVENIDAATLICVSTIDNLSHKLAILYPDPLDTRALEFVNEVTRMIVGYLQGGSSAR